MKLGSEGIRVGEDHESELPMAHHVKTVYSGIMVDDASTYLIILGLGLNMTRTLPMSLVSFNVGMDHDR